VTLRRRSRAAVVLLQGWLAFAASTARAEEGAEGPDEAERRTEPAEAAPDSPARATSAKKPRKQAKKGGDQADVLGWLSPPAGNAGKLEVHGRLFARAAFSRHYVVTTDQNGSVHEEAVDALDLSVPSARAELYYRAPFRWLTANLEFEFAGKPELKDAWLRAKTRHFFAKVGQFKTPFSAIELESIWTLPMARRGTLHDILVDELEVAGRRPAISVGARTGGSLDISLTLGAAQGSVLVDRSLDDRDVELLDEQALRAQSLFARTEVAFDDVTFGIGYEHRVGTPDVFVIEHYPTFGADAVLDTRVLGRGLRVWVEGMAGASWFEHSRKPSDDRDAVFSAGRLVVAPRLGGHAKRDLYLEPYGMLGLFDPDTEVAEDLVFEEALGVNAGFWRLARLGLELELASFQRNFPVSYGLAKNPDRLALLLQASAEF
jgi:hypothetical protein